MKRHLPGILAACVVCTFVASRPASAQSVLFDFDSVPLRSPLPIDLNVGGIHAHFSATGQGFSIQDSSAPVVPIGFTGRFIYPSSVFPADLLIGFSPALKAFSIQYSPQELGCDDSATMRVTAYMGGVLVGSRTTTVPQPGTWPVGTLSCSFPQGFDGVVVHYDHRPPTCQDWGPIFLADNMQVTPLLPPDTTPPTITCPPFVRVIDAKNGTPGTFVFFSVTAGDDRDPAPTVVCVPPSGSLFPRGTTIVTCTATDASGNQAVRTFPVSVMPSILRKRL